tara:strand:+ start:1123 stop:1383 length:261 start_codon:yes stop_codon:yes gene_type:complete
MVCDMAVDVISCGCKYRSLNHSRGMIEVIMTAPRAMDSSPSGLIEEALAEIGDAIGEKIDHKWWSKMLYPMFVLIFLSIPIIYYFW